MNLPELLSIFVLTAENAVEYSVMVNSEELIGSTEYVTL